MAPTFKVWKQIMKIESNCRVLASLRRVFGCSFRPLFALPSVWESSLGPPSTDSTALDFISSSSPISSASLCSSLLLLLCHEENHLLGLDWVLAVLPLP